MKGQWPAARAAHAAAKMGSQVLIFGGRHDRHRVNDLWLLDMPSMTWREVKCDFAPEGRSWHSLTAISDEEALLYGGLSSERQPLADCFVYNLRLNRWLTVSVRPEPRLWHSAVFSDKDQQVFIYGGGTSDILDHSIKPSEVSDRCHDTLHSNLVTRQIYTNDLITMRFCPDSLVHLCLNACTTFSDILLQQFHELPLSLADVLNVRSGADS